MTIPQAQWLRYGAYTLVIVSVVLGGYYFLYVQQHATQLENDRLAALKESSTYFTEEIVRLKENLDNTLTEDQLNEGAAEQRDSLLASKLREIEGIVDTPVDMKTPETWGDHCFNELDADSPPSIYAHFEPAAPHPRLHFEFLSDGPCRVATATPHSLLRPLLPQSETAFDQILLVRKDGKMLLPGNGERLSILEIPLPDHADAPNGTGALHTDVFTLEAAGASYRAFLQPFQLPLPVSYQTQNPDVFEGGPASKQEPLYLTGLKNETAFQSEARQFPPMVGFGLLGLLGLTLLAFPFLEVWLISPTERFKAQDILEVAVGVIILAAVTTLILVSAFCYDGLTERQSNNLEELSGVIANTLKMEANAAGAQLDGLTKVLGTCIATSGDDCIRKTRILDPSAVSDNQSLSAVDTVSHSWYFHLEMVSWIDRNGEQVAKWSVGPQTTPLIDVADRGYFRAHASAIESPVAMPDRDQVWRKTRADSTEWVLQSIRSNTTGKVYAQLSKPIPPSEAVHLPSGQGRTAVAAASIPLLSLVNPVLPTGYGFALITDDGEVLFHEDPRRNLRENLFDKVGNSQPLREAVQAHRDIKLTTRYRGDPHQFYSAPLADSPWTLLVFSNLDSVRGLQGQTLTYAIGLYLGGMLLLLPLVLMPCMALSSRIDFGLTGLFQAVWPDPHKILLYRRLVQWELGLVGVGLLLLTLLILEVASLLSVVGLFVVGGLSIGLLCYYCSRPAPEGEGPWPQDWSKNYLRSLVLLTIIVGGLLPAGVYCLLHNESAQLFIKEKQNTFAHTLAERGDQITEQYRHGSLRRTPAAALKSHLFPEGAWTDTSTFADAGPSRPYSTSLPTPSADTSDSSQTGSPLATEGWITFDMVYASLTRTWQEKNAPWDVHTPSIRSGPPTLEGDASTQPTYDLLGAAAFAPWGEYLYMLSDPASSDDTWAWRRTGDTLVFAMDLPHRPRPLEQETAIDLERATASDRTLQIQSPVPTVAALFSGSRYQIGGGLLVFALLIGLWWTLHRYLIAQVYFLDAVPTVEAEQRRTPVTYATSSPPPRSLFIRRYRGPDEEQEPSTHYINSAVLRHDPDSEALAQEAEASAAEVVVVDNLHDGLREPEVAQEKLALLEALADLDKAVELYSDVDPLSVLRTLSTDAAADAPSESPPRNWAVVLRDYRRYWDTPPQEDPEELPLDTLQPAADLDDNAQATANLDCLARECRHDSYLRQNVAPYLADTLALDTLDEEQVIEQVQYQAEAHYQHLWATCSEEEKVVLYRLSTDGFASPNSRQIVEDLLRRGLLVMTPALRPMNESFRTFVATLHSPVVAEYNRQSQNESWRRVQTPLLLGLTAVVAFVLITQPDLAQEVGALLPTLAAGLPALLKILSTLFAGPSVMSFTD